MRALHISAALLTSLFISDAIATPMYIPSPHLEREKMSPDRKRELVVADLRSILTEPISPTSVATTPYASTRNGLCRRDVVQIAYVPLIERRYEGPFKPLQVRVTAQFHWLGYEGTGSRGGWQKECKKLSGVAVYWASSESDTVAAWALSRFKETIADVQKDRRFTLDCDKLRINLVKTSCVDEFLATANDIMSARKCVDQNPECYEFGSNRYEIKISRTYPSTGDGVSYSTAIEMDHVQVPM
jgi:hypothetical protein